MKKSQAKNIDIAHIAKLAGLKLTPAEETKYREQLQHVLDYFKNLEKVNTDKVEPIANITGLQNISRQDEPAPSLSQDDALKNAKKTHNGFFEVDAIFNNG